MSDWQKAQELELAFHRSNEWRGSAKFASDTADLFQYFGFAADQFAGKPILDVGAGSRLRTKFFEGAKIYTIEPLAERYRDFPHCDLPERTYAQPAEKYIAKLPAFAAVFCINVLDHSEDPQAIVKNCIKYARKGILCISLDVDAPPDDLHPTPLTEAQVDGWLEGLNINKIYGLHNFPKYGRGRAVTWIKHV